jgi:glycosyltransferase involved in cell wall biosynthesis
MRKINVLQLMTDSKIAGAEKIVLELAKGMDKNRFNVIVCCLSGEGPIFDEAKKNNIKIMALGIQSKFYFLRSLKLIKLLKDERIDILQTHLFHANLCGRILGRLGGVKIIISTEHIMGFESGVRILLNRMTSFLVDRYIAISFGIGEFLNKTVGISSLKITVIKNGIDLDKFISSSFQDINTLRRNLGFNPGDKVVGIVARLHKQKGHVFLLQAFKDVVQAIPNAKLLIVGNGPLKKRLGKIALDLGIGNNVIFTGFRDDIADIMLLIDLLVSPSLWEGLPVTILEAMAAKKPVVATNVGGVLEVVEDGVSGILIKPRDTNALADALIGLLGDNQLRMRMGEAGWSRLSENFNAKRMIKETEELYETLVKLYGRTYIKN